MFERLPKILKSITSEEGETFYTIILKKRFLFPWLYKTAKIYKNWEDDSSELEVEIKKYDSRNYSVDIDQGNLEVPDVEEIINLVGMIRDLPRKTLNKIYRGIKKEMFHNKSDGFLYGAEMQNLSKIGSPSKDLQKRLVS
jgi:hypothetical protein